MKRLIAGESASYLYLTDFDLVERIGIVKTGLPARLLTMSGLVARMQSGAYA